MDAPVGRDAALVAHLRAWLGTWPPASRVSVVGADQRTLPAWDGVIAPLLGVATPAQAVVSVAPDHRAAVAAIADPLDDARGRAALATAIGRPDATVGRGVFRWSQRVADARSLPDAGEWVDPQDPRVPLWLHPFNYGPVLVAWGDTGEYAAGVGIKRHDPCGRELAVVTAVHTQGRGLGRRLVAQAARRVLSEGGLPTYLHDPANAASGRVADAVGFPDRGWSVYQLFDRGDG